MYRPTCNVYNKQKNKNKMKKVNYSRVLDDGVCEVSYLKMTVPGKVALQFVYWYTLFKNILFSCKNTLNRIGCSGQLLHSVYIRHETFSKKAETDKGNTIIR